MKSASRWLLALALSGPGAAGVARAADLPPRYTAPAPYYAAPLFSWAGFYAGVNAGVDFGTGGGRFVANGFTPAAGFAAGPPTGSFGPLKAGEAGAGFVGGAQIGYNFQSGLFVYGLEADIDYFGTGSSDNRTFANQNVYPATGSTLTLSGHGGDGFLGTVRGRLGYAAFDRTLLYVTGGLAYGDYGSATTLARFANGGGPETIDFSGDAADDVRVGYALGAGVEYAFTPRISGEAEYLYTDIGDRTYALTNPRTGAMLTARQDGSAQIGRLGLNYKF